MRKHVLILTTDISFLHKFEKDNVRLLQDTGYHVHYAANKDEPQAPWNKKDCEGLGITFHHIEIARSPYIVKDNLKAFYQVVEIVKKYEIQMIHCHTPVGGVIGRLAGWYFRNEGIKVIYTAHGFHFYEGAPFLNNSVFYLTERVLAHYTDVLVTINKEDYKNARRFHLKGKGEVYKIPGVGLDFEKFLPADEKEREKKRAELGISEEDFFIVSVGELNENKNQKLVLSALKKMKEDKKNSKKDFRVKYGICGTGFFEDRIRGWIREMGLEDCVIMYGFCHNVKEILGCADASVFPSKREGLGMAGLEALAMGVPLLASDNRGTREYMQDGKNGYVFQADDIDSMMKSLEKIQNLDQKKMEKMKAYCRESVAGFDKKYTSHIMNWLYRRTSEEAVRWGYEEYSQNQCNYECLQSKKKRRAI